MRPTLATLVTSGLLLILLLVSPNPAFGENSRIEKPETITFAPDSKLGGVPFSICTIGEDLFLLSDLQEGKVKIFEKNGNSLKFIKNLEIDGVLPTYSFYSQNEDRYGFFDYLKRRVLIFDRVGKVGFTQIADIPCQWGCYDLEFAGDGNRLVVSGYLPDAGDNPYDLYTVSIENNEIKYQLPAHEKYDLKNTAEYVNEYRKKQTVAAVGTQAYIDILGDDLFFAWEGSLRIIKINLNSQKKTIFNEPEPGKISHYIKPDRDRLGESYLKGDFKGTFEKQRTMGYVRNIWAVPGQIHLMYETGIKSQNSTSRFKLITYTANGEFLDNSLLPGNSIMPMWFDKDRSELYAFTRSSGEFSILKYRIR